MTSDAPTSKIKDDSASRAAPEPGSTEDRTVPRSRRAALVEAAKQALPFIASWVFLDVMVNLRYPGQEPRLWYIVPSTDIIFLFGYLAVFGWNKWRVPTYLRAFVVVLVLFIRFLRFGDGAMKKTYFQPFNFYTDLHLVPELVRFSYATLPWWEFWLAAVGVVVGFVVMAIVTYHALTCAERYLTNLTNVRNVAVFSVVSYVVLSMFPRDPYYSELYFGGFARSVFPRLQHEGKFLLNVYGLTAEKTKAIAVAQERLAQAPSNLAKLHHANVYLILVESYGRAVFDQPLLEESSRAAVDAFESEIGQHGFSMVSGMIDSPTYGGQSWLAQSTLATGVRVADQLQYEIISSQRPKTIAVFFHNAGYRTVLVHPGTQRPWPKGDFYQFDHKYYSWNFEYAGPKFSWATMPDQFVLDFIRRAELDKPTKPLFVEYALVTSHAPWSRQPVLVDDWSKIKNGAIYNDLEVVQYPITWPDFANASEAYIRSIIYEFDVLKRYISDYVRDDSLVILIGDHQPVKEISGDFESYGVPVHVISRDASFMEPFVARGYVRGARPQLDQPCAPMDEFLIDFLTDFSTSGAAAE